MRLILSLVAMVMVATSSMQAAVVTFTATSGTWSSPGNWDTSTVPTGADDVIIPATKTAIIAAGDVYSANSVSIAGTLSLAGGNDGEAALAIAAGCTVTGALNLGNSVNNVAGLLTLDDANPTITGTGTVTMVSGSNANRSKIIFSGAASVLTFSGGLTANCTGIFQGPIGSGDVAIAAGSQVAIPAGTSLSLSNIGTFTNAGTLAIGKDGTLACNLNSAFTNSGTINWIIGLNQPAIQLTSFANLGGTLNLTLGSGVSPAQNQTVNFLTTKSANNSISTITATGFTVTPDPAWSDEYQALSNPDKIPKRDYSFKYLLQNQTVTFAPASLQIGTNTTQSLPSQTGQGATITYQAPELVPTGIPASTITGTTLNAGPTGEVIRIRYSAPAVVGFGALSSFVEYTIVQSPTVSITATPASGWSYGDQITVTLNSNSGGAVTWNTSGLTNASFDGVNLVDVTNIGAGGTLSASVAANGIYSAGNATLNLGTFAARPVTVTVNGGTRAYNNGNNPTPAITITQGTLASGDTLSTLGTPLFAGTGTTAIATTDAGSYPITATLSGTPSTYSVTIVPGNLIITPAPQTITFASLDGIQIGGTVTLSATASSGLPVSFISGSPTVASISGNVATGLIQGSSVISASQAGDSNWLAAPTATQTLTVGLQSQTITFPAISALKVGETGILTAIASSGLAVTYTSSDTNIAQISGATVVAIGPGTVTITANQAGNGTYAPATPVTATLSIGKADQTITFAALTTSIEVGSSANLGATSSAGLAITYTSSAAAIARISGATVVGVAPGTATITATQAGNANFNPATDVAITVTVVAAPAGATTGTPEKAPEGGGCGAGSGIALLLGLGAWLGLGFRRRTECSARR